MGPTASGLYPSPSTLRLRRHNLVPNRQQYYRSHSPHSFSSFCLLFVCLSHIQFPRSILEKLIRGIWRSFYETFSKITLQISQHPTLRRLLSFRVLWTTHHYFLPMVRESGPDLQSTVVKGEGIEDSPSLAKPESVGIVFWTTRLIRYLQDRLCQTFHRRSVYDGCKGSLNLGTTRACTTRPSLCIRLRACLWRQNYW